MHKRHFQMPTRKKMPEPSMTTPLTIDSKQTSENTRNPSVDEKEQTANKSAQDTHGANKCTLANVMAILREARDSSAEEASVAAAENNVEVSGADKTGKTVGDTDKTDTSTSTLESTVAEKPVVTKNRKEKSKSVEKEKTLKKDSRGSNADSEMQVFKSNCEALIEAQMRYRALQKESRQLNEAVQKLREQVISVLLRYNRSRVNCARHSMYISTHLAHRPTAVGVKQLYEIIEQTLGKDSLAAVQKEAQTRRQQKKEQLNKIPTNFRQRMNELLLQFKTKLQSNNADDDDFANAYNIIVGFMQRQRITTICNNEPFFADLYNHYGLQTMLERGVPMHCLSTHEHALLYCYTLHGPSTSATFVCKPFGVVTQQQQQQQKQQKNGKTGGNNALVQDQDSSIIATTIGVTAEYARTDNVFERAFDAMVKAAASLMAAVVEPMLQPVVEPTVKPAVEPAVEHWRQHEWSSFTDSFDEYEKSFDCAEFFYGIFVSAPPTGDAKQQRKLFDAKYARLWKKIQSQEGAEYVSHVAWLLCNGGHVPLCNGAPLLALIRNHRGDGSDGLLATMARCCERVQLLDSLRLAMDRRARQLLRRTTVTYTAQQNDSSSIDLCVTPVRHVFMMGCAVLDWCRLVDASVGRLGEGAARLRCCFAETELPMVGRDASLFFGLDRIPATVVQWHASCGAEKTDGFTLYGDHGRLGINVRVVADNVSSDSAVEDAAATVQLLFGDRSSFDSILCCLYYSTGRPRAAPPLNTLLEPLLPLSASKCASKANELMHARRAFDRFGHIDAFHWLPTAATLPYTTAAASSFTTAAASFTTAAASSSSSSSSSATTSAASFTSSSTTAVSSTSPSSLAAVASFPTAASSSEATLSYSSTASNNSTPTKRRKLFADQECKHD